MLGHLVVDFAGLEASFAGVAQPGYYRVQFGKVFAQTPHVVATVRDVSYAGGGPSSQPWTVYLKDVHLAYFDIVVQRGGQPVQGGSVPAAADQTQPIYVYWIAIGIR